jgi:hypothetical protein
MSAQPKAMQLANRLEEILHDWTVAHLAAAELRRLYAEVDSLSYRLAYPDNFVCEECDELLEALKEVLNCDKTRTSFGAVMRARAALSKFQGENHE